MVMNDTSCVFEVIYQTIQQSDNKLSVSRLCQTAGVSRSGYYAWIAAAPLREAREKQDRRDFELILLAYRFRGYDKGARGIHMRLLHLEDPVNMNIKKIRRLMKKYGLMCKVRKANPYRRMAKALKTSNYAANILDRQFEAYGPRIVLLTDITYISYNGTFAYLSVIMDAFTKQVLAHVLSDSLEVDFVLETVNILIDEHGISLHAETIIHSDQGCHYTSHKFIDIIKDSGLRQSMSRRGNCWDNAPQESFFGRMKDLVKALGGKEAKTHAGLLEGNIFRVCQLCHLCRVLIPDIRIKRGNQHKRAVKIVVHTLCVGFYSNHTVRAEGCHRLCQKSCRLQEIIGAYGHKYVELKIAL
jgi:transposase InsO family protein